MASATPLKSKQVLTFKEYQRKANRTDKNSESNIKKRFILPLLGLFGETGSVLAEAKKKKREARAHIGFTEGIREELGDALWYATNIASQFSIKLESIANTLNINNSKRGKRVTDFRGLEQRVKANLSKRTTLDLELLTLAGHVGDLVNDAYLKTLDDDVAAIRSHLAHILHSIVCVAIKTKISISEVAAFNLDKIDSRWPTKKLYHPLFDDGYPIEEQLPRKLDIHFKEYRPKNKTFVIQKIYGLNIGDRLTDNIDVSDDYKYHDVFHWAYVAVMGWSPVIRGLLRCKRKSDPVVDENQDGARAAIMEEALSVWIFHQAKQKDYFRGLTSLDYGILKAAKTLIHGFEIESVPLWQLEEAIVKGFGVFRELKLKRHGIISIDLQRREITFRDD